MESSKINTFIKILEDKKQQLPKCTEAGTPLHDMINACLDVLNNNYDLEVINYAFDDSDVVGIAVMTRKWLDGKCNQNAVLDLLDEDDLDLFDMLDFYLDDDF